MREVSPQELREMVDRAQIHDVIMRYCRGVDRCDLELVASAFHDDAVDDHGAGPAPISELIERLGAGRDAVEGMMHFVGNECVEFDGDVAYSETYFISYSTSSPDGVPRTRTRGGRYLDRFERRANEWKIANRTLIDEWSRLDEVHAVATVRPGNRGSRSREDMVYRLRGDGAAGSHAS